MLHDPPLNLFGAEAFRSLNECLDELEGTDARALVWRAEGDVFTGGADVNVFAQADVSQARGRSSGRCSAACSASRRSRSRPWRSSTASA